MKGPPSSGQLLIAGSCEMVVVSARAAPPRVFFGSDFQAVNGAEAKVKGCRRAAVGSAFSRRIFRTLSSVFRNMNLQRSGVPKRLAAHGKGEPLTLSNKTAGPSAV